MNELEKLLKESDQMKEQEQFKIFKRKSSWLCYAIPPLTSQMAIYTKHKTKAEALKQLDKEIDSIFKFKSAAEVLATIYKANGDFDSHSLTSIISFKD